MTERERRAVSKLKKSLDSETLKIKSYINRAYTNGITTQAELNAYITNTRAIYQKMMLQFGKFADVTIPVSYIESIKGTWDKLKKGAWYPQDHKYKHVKDLIHSDRTRNSIALIKAAAIDDFANAAGIGNREASNYYRMTQQLHIEEKMINKTLADGLAESRGINAPKKKIYEALHDKIKDGKVVVINKNGKPMHFEPKYYAEMVARSRIAEAHTVSIISMALDLDTEYVQVSAHNTTTLLCQEFEGKVFTITGSDSRFPELDLYPPFHPNCLHNITPIFVEMMEARGIDKYINFANGKTDIPAYLPSYIPLSKRGDDGN